MGFYDLKRMLFFPQIAGFMRAKKDVPYLYELLLHERGCTRETMALASSVLLSNGYKEAARRIQADWKMIDQTYEHDIALCSQFMLDNGIMPI